jgi:hypothetical protein
MPKRARSSSVELIAVDDTGIIIEWNSKEYYVYGPDHVRWFQNCDLEIDVFHNFENRAMLNVRNIRYDEDVLRQEINPFKFKDVKEWVRDD